MTRPYGRLFSGVDCFPGGFTPPYGITLPTFLDTTRPDVSGYTPTVVTALSALDAAYAAADAANGGLIHIGGGASTVLTTWTPADRTTSGWIVIEAENTAGFDGNGVRVVLPAGQRMDPTTGSNLPVFQTDVDNLNVSAITINPGVHHVRLRSLAFYQPPTTASNEALIGPGTNGDDAHDMVIEQCCFTQHKTSHLVRGVALFPHHSAVIDSWLDVGRSIYQEGQSVCTWSNQGVMKVVNNYMSGLGECFMIGGDQPRNPGDAALTYYPKDLEFRRNHLGHPLRYMGWSQAWANYWDDLRSGLTVATNSGTTLTLSVGTFDTTEYSGFGGKSFRLQNYAICTAGSAVGSYAEITGYNSVTSAIVGEWIGTPPTAGDTISVREGITYVNKDVFELKNCRRAYAAENVLEGHWTGETSQYFAVNLKSVNQSSGAGIYSQTRDVCFYDTLIWGVNGGLSLSRAPEPPALDMEFIHFDNTLWIGNGIGGTRQAGIQLDGHDYHFTKSSLYRFGERTMLVLPDVDSGTGAKLDNTDTFDRSIFAVRDGAPFGWTTDAISFDPAVGFPGAFDVATSSLTNSGFVDPTYGTSHYNESTYMTGNVAVLTEAAMKLVNPTTDFWGAADWSPDVTSPFRDGAGTFGVDYADLVARTAGVRASTSDVPMDDWKVNGIVGTGGTGGPSSATQLLLSTAPIGVRAGLTLTQQPIIRVADVNGLTVTSDGSQVVVALVVESGAAAPIGTLTVDAEAGIAAFTDLGIASTAEINAVCHWHFADGSLTGVDGPSFTVLTSLAPAVL